jgi:hypothetical protein
MSDMDITIRDLMDLCMSENDQRPSGYDPCLVQPTTTLDLVRFPRRFMCNDAFPSAGVAA